MSSPRPLGPLCPPCTPHSTLNRVRIYMTSQSLQCSSYLGWAAPPVQKQDIWKPPSSCSPHPLLKLSLRTTEDNLFIRGLWCWEHRQMAPELAAQQTQKVPNTISSKQPELSPPPIKCGEQCSQPFPGTLIWTPHPPDPGISASQRLRERAQGPGVSGRGEKWQESSVATAEGHRWLLTISVKVSAHPLLSQCKAGAGGGCPAWGEISQSPCIQVGQEAHSF